MNLTHITLLVFPTVCYNSSANPMHISFILTQSLSSPSGIGRYWPLAKELVRLGHQVTILALHHDFTRGCKHSFIQEGVQVQYVSQMHVRKFNNRKLYYNSPQLLLITILATWRLTWAALHTPADVYHVCKPHPMNSIAGILVSKLRKKPMFLDCDDYETESNRFSSAWQKKVVAFFENTIPRCATAITVNTEFTLQRLINLGYPATRIFYIPNGVDRQRFNNIDAGLTKKIKQELGLTNNKIILYVGSLSLPSHPVDLLIDAFAQVLSVIPQARLVLVGGGEEYERLEQQAQSLGIANATLFVGHIPPEQVPYYLHLADVTVDPVYNDETARARSPLKVFESLAAGVPVVTSDVGERKKIIDQGKGILVEPGSAQALASGICTILTNPNSMQVDQVPFSFYWDLMAQSWVQVYQTKLCA